MELRSSAIYYAELQTVDKLKLYFFAAVTPHFVFPLTRAAEKHLASEKPLNQRFFKGAGVVLAGMECSPEISDFRANGIPVQERVDFFDTLKLRNILCGASFLEFRRDMFWKRRFWSLSVKRSMG